MEISGLSDLQLDALREVGNIGAGNAATALSLMVRQRIGMSVPKASVLPVAEVPGLLGGPETRVWAIYLSIMGALEGHVLFLLPEPSAAILADLVMGRAPGTTRSFDSMAESALAEVGNILTGHYLMAMGSFTRLELLPSPPQTANDMAGAILQSLISSLSATSNAVLALETEFEGAAQDLQGLFLVFPTPEALPRLLGSLGMP